MSSYGAMNCCVYYIYLLFSMLIVAVIVCYCCRCHTSAATEPDTVERGRNTSALGHGRDAAGLSTTTEGVLGTAAQPRRQ